MRLKGTMHFGRHRSAFAASLCNDDNNAAATYRAITAYRYRLEAVMVWTKSGSVGFTNST